MTGKLKGFYDNKDKATLELKIKFGDFKFNDVKIKEGGKNRNINLVIKTAISLTPALFF